MEFLSTPSGWRATYCIQRILRNNQFLSTPSGWRATGKGRVNTNAGEVFLSTPSGWRATFVKFMITVLHSDFYPRPPGGGRPSFGQSTRRRQHFYPRPPGGGRRQKRTKFSSVFAQKGEEFASLRRGKRKICRWRFKKDKFWVLIWCEGSGKSVCALASHCG